MELSQEVYKRRRDALMERMDDGIMILPSNPESIMSNDVHYVYRQNSNVIYLTGFKEPNTVVILLKKDEEQKFIMFVPPRDPATEIWNGRREGVEGAKKRFHADDAFSIESIEEQLPELINGSQKLYYTFGVNPEIDELVLKLQNQLKQKRGYSFPTHIIDPEPLLHEMRLIKSKEEIEIMKKGSKISIEAHLEAIKSTKPGMFEFEIEAIYDYIFKKNGAKRAAYPSIVGSGKNATILHYITNDSELREGDLLLVDAGCEYNDYAIDITRTWPISGKFSETQKTIYQIVLSIQEECIEKCLEGAKFGDLHDHCVKRISEELINIGLLEGPVEKVIEEETYKKFFMHGLGHNLGIDTHDVSRIPLKETILKEGMVVTIEPGIYIPDSEEIPEEYRGIGVRIEDDIVITKNGPLNLTDALPKSIEEIENLVGNGQLFKD